MSTRPDSADMEIQRIQGGHRLSPAPSLALTEGDYGEPDKSGKRSTLQGLVLHSIKGFFINSDDCLNVNISLQIKVSRL